MLVGLGPAVTVGYISKRNIFWLSRPAPERGTACRQDQDEGGESFHFGAAVELVSSDLTTRFQDVTSGNCDRAGKSATAFLRPGRVIGAATLRESLYQ